MEVDLNEEELAKRHKQERKDLQAKIQSLKKSVPKGDKKKKKEVTEEVARLEAELESRQNAEVQGLNPQKSNDAEEASTEENVESEEPPTRVSRATRRRNKKAQEEKERDKRIQDQAERNREGPRMMEMNAMKEVLKKSGLQLHNIPADGNCLYCAINHQLEVNSMESFSVTKLRKLTADFMRKNKDEFLPFMYNESDEAVSEEYFESYCKEVATTKLWGGQLELRALSNILQCPIKVVQANGPPTIQGEHFKGPELILAYHRHLYRLGEHYNSTVAAQDGEGED